MFVKGTHIPFFQKNGGKLLGAARDVASSPLTAFGVGLVSPVAGAGLAAIQASRLLKAK
jgi:hypothetical protein